MKLKIKKKTTLGELPAGSLFLSEDMSTLGMKSEYHTGSGACEAFIVGSGEMFWGGVSSGPAQQALVVFGVKVTDKKNLS